MPQNKAAMESELKRLEMEEELARLEAEEAADQAATSGPGIAEKIETAGRSLAEGITAGISEPAISAVNAVLGNLISSGYDADSLKDFFSKSVDAARIQKEYESDVERRRGLEKALPGYAISGEIAGAMTPFGAPAKIAKGAASAVKGLAKIPAVGSIIAGAAEAALGGLGAEAVKQATQIPTGVMEPGEGPALGEVTTSGAKIGAGLSAIPVVGKAMGAAVPRVMSAFGGVSPKIISDYLKREAPLEPVTSEKLQEAVTIAAQNVQDTLKTIRSTTADDLVTAVQVLKEEVINGSQEAFAILEAEGSKKGGITLPFQIIEDVIGKSIYDLRKGAKALTPVREKAAGYLEEIRSGFATRANAKGQIDLVTAKEMLQAIDEVKNVTKGAGEFSSSLDIGLGKLRRVIDEPLKKIPAYRQKMEEVRNATELLSQANEYFGEADKAFKNVERLVIGKDPYITATAKKLEDMTGVQINLGLDSIRGLRPVQNLMPDNTETFVKAVMSKEGAQQTKLQTLSMMADEDLVALANQAFMTKEFGKLVQNGSRDVNFWKEALGFASGVGAAGGVMAGPIGGATGAMVGYMVKSYGARATKLVLDSMIKVRGIPTVQKLDQALSSVPPEVKQDLMNGFIRANILRLDPSEPQTMTLPPEQASQVYSEIKDSDLDAVSKSNALRSLSKDGSISTRTMKQYMAGMKAPRQPVKPAMKKNTLEQDRPDRLKR